ncbi:MAG TPA: hypothetical protein VFH77_00015, partial [Streptomyces sp.]|nr:hypothetical protein [Streptomyces sp.]
ECLLGVQQEDGSMPGPRFDPRVCAALPEQRRAEYAFQRTYHTTLVMAMALATHLDMPTANAAAELPDGALR